jgi:hypothetical protein
VLCTAPGCRLPITNGNSLCPLHRRTAPAIKPESRWADESYSLAERALQRHKAMWMQTREVMPLW